MADVKELVTISDASTSKINWTQFVGAAAMLLTYFGIDIPPETQAMIVVIIGIAAQGLTVIFRSWFTKKPATAPEVRAAAVDKGLVAVHASDVKASAKPA